LYEHVYKYKGKFISTNHNNNLGVRRCPQVPMSSVWREDEGGFIWGRMKDSTNRLVYQIYRVFALNVSEIGDMQFTIWLQKGRSQIFLFVNLGRR